MDQLWLGYDGLTVECAQVSAVLLYQPALASKVLRSYGRIPANIRAVVVTGDGAYLPSSWTAQQLRVRLTRWRSSLQN